MKVGELDIGRSLTLERQPYICIRILSNVHNSYILLFQIIVSKDLEYVSLCLKKNNLLIVFTRTNPVPVKTQDRDFSKIRTTNACTTLNRIDKDLYNLYIL